MKVTAQPEAILLKGGPLPESLFDSVTHKSRDVIEANTEIQSTQTDKHAIAKAGMVLDTKGLVRTKMKNDSHVQDLATPGTDNSSVG